MRVTKYACENDNGTQRTDKKTLEVERMWWRRKSRRGTNVGPIRLNVREEKVRK